MTKLIDCVFQGWNKNAMPDRNHLIRNVAAQLDRDDVLATDAAIVNTIRRMDYYEVATLARLEDPATDGGESEGE